MTKAQLQSAVEAKLGFHSIIEDNLAPDNKVGDLIEKRYFYINHSNADGTMGKTFIFYLLNTTDNTASFYNVEPEAVDNKEPSIAQKRAQAIESYLKTNFDSFFINRLHSVGNTTWVEADVYSGAVTLTKATIIATKIGGPSVVTHKVVI